MLFPRTDGRSVPKATIIGTILCSFRIYRLQTVSRSVRGTTYEAYSKASCRQSEASDLACKHLLPCDALSIAFVVNSWQQPRGWW